MCLAKTLSSVSFSKCLHDNESSKTAYCIHLYRANFSGVIFLLSNEVACVSHEPSQVYVI